MIIRKIQERKRAVQLLGGIVIGPCGFFSGLKTTQVVPNVLMRDVSLEAVAKVSNPFEFSRTPRLPVAHVLCVAAKPEVFSTVIKAVAVDVVYETAFGGARYKSMEVQDAPLILAGGVNVPARGLDNEPLAFGDSRHVAFANLRRVPAIKLDFSHA